MEKTLEATVTHQAENIQAVQLTADDSLISKFSAVTSGYYPDPFIKYFCKKQTTKRSPIINRGYWSRVAAVDAVIRSFFEAKSPQISEKRQIISIGAGFDTTFFRLKQARLSPAAYIELDFPEIVGRKVSHIIKNKELNSLLGERRSRSSEPSIHPSSQQHRISEPSIHSSNIPPTSITPRSKELHSSGYHLMSCDLRDVNQFERIINDYVDLSLPTLIIAECVFVYMRTEHLNPILKLCAEKFRKAGALIATYDPIKPDDPFGRTMLENLAQAGCSLPGLLAFPTIQSREELLKSLGWSHVRGWTMNEVYEFYLTREEKIRAEKLEIFDEFEEWRLIQDHYAIVLAAVDPTPVLHGAVSATINETQIKRVQSPIAKSPLSKDVPRRKSSTHGGPVSARSIFKTMGFLSLKKQARRRQSLEPEANALNKLKVIEAANARLAKAKAEQKEKEKPMNEDKEKK